VVAAEHLIYVAGPTYFRVCTRPPELRDTAFQAVLNRGWASGSDRVGGSLLRH